ncbi:MAG: undecaprenyldiphospho-muramoylpentapeptide beta-N-acetylglucosaminyltransferase [Moraxellaceae bacterium]|nr:undecaprenyldiphospho-muramoylpentapeptide beta-N-acetylglucosaminyltransferase [Pseudobdellovibrionaceae bacterium]
MKIIVAGGGTGGHIYPAISVVQSLQKIDSTIEILFVGTPQGLESKIIPQAGYKLELIQSGKLNFSGQLMQKLKSLLKVPVGLVQSFNILFQEKPDFVLGVGGYASAPLVFAAALKGHRTAIWEPNAHPGMANRILSRFVDKSYLVFADAAKYLKSKNNLVLGMPLRSEIENASLSRTENSDFTILCFGGSQGSMFLNDKISDLILQNLDVASKIKIVHQTGPRDFKRMQEKYKNHPSVELHEYIYDMPRYYNQADLLFCRGGASTLAEAAAFGVVPVVVPLPAADDHQQRNAEALVKVNAGFMFLQNDFNDKQFLQQINHLIENKITLKEMSVRLKQVVTKGAADKIARDILNSIKK